MTIMINISRYFHGVHVPMDLKQWCKNQAEEAKKYKWIRGIELGKDPGDTAIVEWVEKYAGVYRKEFKQYLESITNKVSESVHEKMPDIDKEILSQITSIVIEEFTKEWIKECAKDNKHIQEI